MPILIPLLFGTGIFAAVQADDAIETATGERVTAGLPTLQIVVLAVVAFYLWRMMKKA